MAELEQWQKDILEAQRNQQAMVALGQPDTLVDRSAPGYSDPQTVEELAKAMPVGPRPQPKPLDPDLDKAIADALAKTMTTENAQKSWTEAGGIRGWSGEFARSMGEGVATLPDLPIIAGVGAKNIYNRFAGNPLEDPQNFDFQAGPFRIHGTPVSNLYNKVLPPDANFPEAREWGNVAGPVLVTGPLGAAEATIPGLIARTALTTGGVKVGGDVGGAAGEKLFGEPGKTYGTILGSAAGGGVTQPLAQTGGYRVLNRMLADPGNEFVAGSSASKLAAALRQGIPESVGLVGNRFGRLVEDLIANIPGASGPPSRMRRAQFEAYDETARRNAGLIDPTGQPPTGPVSKGGLGLEANRVAETADDSITRRLNQIYDRPDFGLHAQTDPATGQVLLPREAPSLPATQRQVLGDLATNPRTNQAYQGPTIQNLQEDLQTSSNLIADPAYEQALDARGRAVDAHEAQVANDPSIDPANRAVFERQIADRREQIAQERAANRAPSFESERTARQEGAITPEGVPNNRRILEAARVARETDMRNTAIAAGIDPTFYDNVDNWASQLLGQRVSIKALLSDRFGNAAKPNVLHTAMFGDSGITNAAQMRTLIEHAPGPLRTMLARQYERMTRGPAAGTREPSPETFDPQKAVTFWDQQNDPTIREGYTGGSRAAEQGTADLQTVLRGELGRPKRSVPGKGGNTLGSPGVFTGLLSALLSGGAAALSGTGASILGGPLMAAAAGVPLAARFIGSRFVDPGFTQRVVHPPGLGEILNQPNLSRILSSAVTGGMTDASAAKEAKRQAQLMRR